VVVGKGGEGQVTLAIIGQPRSDMTSKKILPVAPIHGIVSTPVGATYNQTGAKVVIVSVKPPRRWPEHCLRAVFDNGCGFTFHRGMIHEWFKVDAQ
jgi:hypothetical protein